MKIPLDVLQEEINLTATIRAPHICGSINFLVDTGSNVSFIGATDMQRLGISKKHLRFREDDKIYWGDAPFRLAKLRKVELWVKTSDNTLHILRLPFIFVSPDLVHTKEGSVSPNILGLDFLRKQRLKCLIDGANNAAHFETA